MNYYLILLGILWVLVKPLQAQIVVVAADGSGKFTSIQQAIESIPSSDSSGKQREIFIKNGHYPEKLWIENRHFLTIRGESEKGVIIEISLPRDVWRCANPDDWGAATLNIKSHDLIFENLTVLNSYGFTVSKDTIIPCAGESGLNAGNKQSFALPRESNETEGTKLVRATGHQFALRAFPGATRLIFKHCTFRARGGDTVSPWNVTSGMYYFANCTLEGDVDFYCPRGWAYAENCRFICHNKNAAIWHDGSGNKSCKTVLKNCIFEGDNQFKLGRFHKEAQFYLINCQFSESMADADIYWVTAAPKPIEWGKRVYYYNCHRTGGDYPWHANNLHMAGAPKPKHLTPVWTFDGQWNPMKNELKAPKKKS